MTVSVTAASAGYPSQSAVERGLDLLFPPLCVGCRRVGRWICPRCWESATWLTDRTCISCRRPSPTVTCIRCSSASTALDRLIAVASFDGTAREAVHALKFHGHHSICGLLGKLMARAATDADVEVVIPVPLHRSRRRERGYDQSALLASVIARSLNRRHVPTALRRTRATAQQASLDAVSRRNNVLGLTLDSAAQALKDAGASQIIGIVFAYAM